ncbi:MAG: alpha/beta hydrolase [Actinobacteria bacterium]|nr:alpha/beta hydrolase [Actinomycetota bacterium]
MELDTRDVTLHYEDDGDPDAPPILVLHGITQSSATWGWLVPHLAARHRVVRLDFRGHGRSGRTPGRYGFRGYVEDATAVCERVLRGPTVIVGHSLGGGTAAAVAQARPDLVRGVVLEDPPLLGAGAEDVAGLPGNSLLEGFRLMRESVPQLQAAGMAPAELVETLRGVPSPSGPAFGELSYDDALDAMAEALLQLDATVLDPVLEGRSEPVFDPLRELPVPGIVLAADPAMSDAVTRPQDLDRLRKHSPLVECRVVTGSGHLIHDSRQHRQVVLDAVQELLARLT